MFSPFLLVTILEHRWIGSWNDHHSFRFSASRMHGMFQNSRTWSQLSWNLYQVFPSRFVNRSYMRSWSLKVPRTPTRARGALWGAHMVAGNPIIVLRERVGSRYFDHRFCFVLSYRAHFATTNKSKVTTYEYSSWTFTAQAAGDFYKRQQLCLQKSRWRSHWSCPSRIRCTDTEYVCTRLGAYNLPTMRRRNAYTKPIYY